MRRVSFEGEIQISIDGGGRVLSRNDCQVSRFCTATKSQLRSAELQV
jgi:hypothetical protein